MARHKRAPAAQGGAGADGKAREPRRSGQGAGSALVEMLRRQAQNPRPGLSQGSPGSAGDARGEPRRATPRRSDG
ncbi:MAG TPA: hypothetical protein VEA40_20345 [Ramlibacter sp.]|nr:hypothetical protein [Ramlibacter sp.]